jgi:taurine dioxygenase
MEFRPLHPQFGVEVTGFDLQHGGSPAEIAQLRAAYDRHAMLLFRGQDRLNPARHAELAGWFGPPAPVANDSNGEVVSVLHNRDPAGSMQLPFHCDLTYTDVPIKAICLQAVELPDTPTSTTFVSNRAGWQRLAPERQQALAGLTLRHELVMSMTGYDWPPFVADHPLRFPHPRTGEPLLLLTEHHATRILELDDAASAALIAELCAHLYAPECQYDHIWQLGDVLMWDNLVLQHARREPSDFAGGPRALQRVALAEVGLPELVERARARERAEAG